MHMRALLIVALVACGAPEEPRWQPKDWGEPCCACWESWTGGCTAMRLERAPRFACEDRAPRPPLCQSEILAMVDAGLEPDAGWPVLEP